MENGPRIPMPSDRPLAGMFIIYVTTILFFAIGAVTTPELGWYATLTIPGWTPSEVLIAAVWCILFVLTALSMTLFWERAPRDHAFFSTVMLYAGNAALILLWDYSFFGLHRVDVAFGVALLVGLSVLAIIVRTWGISRKAALLLAPYVLWVAFAASLLYVMMLLNP